MTRSNDLSDRDIRQREIVPPEKLAACHVVVIGVGAVAEVEAEHVGTGLEQPGQHFRIGARRPDGCDDLGAATAADFAAGAGAAWRIPSGRPDGPAGAPAN